VASPPTACSRAIVIRALAFGETSQVVHLATPDRGLVPALAKGARRPGPELQGGLALGSVGTAWLLHRRGAELDLLRRFRVTEDLRGLRRDLERFYGCCYVLELLRAWMRPALPAEALYAAALTTLRALAHTAPGGVAGWIVWFEARALAAGGHRPRLEACAACEGPLDGDTAFSPTAGGLVHRACAPPGPRLRLGPHAVRGLRRLYAARLKELAEAPLERAAVAAIREVHDLFVPHVLERRPLALTALARGGVTRP
jgi:DNA repair protein RecO (recombination protein O)